MAETGKFKTQIDTATFKRVAPTSPEVVKLGRALLADEKASLTPEQEKAVLHLADDEFERLPVAERRAFWNDVLKRELKRNGATAGAIAGSGLGSGETPAAVALAEIARAGGANTQAVTKAQERLRSLVVDCVSCEGLVLRRFKAEDDVCRVCGNLLPVSTDFGRDRATRVLKALTEEDLAGDDAVTNGNGGPATTAAAAPLTFPPEPVTWDVVSPKHDPKGLLALSKENLDWDDVLAAIRKVEEQKRIEEEKRQRELEAKRKAEEERKAAEEKKRREAEEKKRQEEEALRAFEEEQKRKEEEKRQVELEAKRKQEEELAAFTAAQEKAETERKEREAEEERIRKIEDARIAIGRLSGADAGKIVRIGDLDPSIKPGQSKAPMCLMAQGKAKLLVPSGSKCFVNDQPAVGIIELKPGDIVKGLVDEGDLSVIDENGELRGVNADPIHLKREDGGTGGPWPYWNEPVKVGASDQCEILVGEPGVDDVHATVTTRFGRVVVEDVCTEADGIWINDAQVKAFVARPGMTFRLGKKGPVLGVGEGQVEVKQAETKAGPMKPSRYVRTCLHIQGNKGGESKVFLFARREIRFGRLFSKGDKVENDLVIAPEDEIQTVADKQGSLSLTRDGVSLQLNDKVVPMSVNDEELRAGQTVALKRRFTIDIGVGITLRGEVYRAPTSVKRPDTPGQLGVEGGHPYECVKMVREDSSRHTYVFLVRQVRLGTGPADSIQLDDPDVASGHATLFLSRGVLQIVAPREKARVKIDGTLLEPGVPHPLKIGSTIELGSTKVRFEITSESDFQVATS
jgi:pSer/pThr/pTyr-binding forkhead associated (FHA) protein